MADINSAQMAQTRANPPTRIAVQQNGGRERYKVGQVTLDGTQSATDVMRFFRVQSSDVIVNLFLSTEALTGLTSVNYGLHNINGGAVVDADLFDATQTHAGVLTKQQKRLGADSALGPETIGQTVWELLGLSEDPLKEYDVTGLINTAGSASGTITVETDYVSGS